MKEKIIKIIVKIIYVVFGFIFIIGGINAIYSTLSFIKIPSVIAYILSLLFPYFLYYMVAKEIHNDAVKTTKEMYEKKTLIHE